MGRNRPPSKNKKPKTVGVRPPQSAPHRVCCRLHRIDPTPTRPVRTAHGPSPVDAHALTTGRGRARRNAIVRFARRRVLGGVPDAAQGGGARGLLPLPGDPAARRHVRGLGRGVHDAHRGLEGRACSLPLLSCFFLSFPPPFSGRRRSIALWLTVAFEWGVLRVDGHLAIWVRSRAASRARGVGYA